MRKRATRRPQSRGRCSFCEKTLTKTGMRRHLEACEVRAAEQRENKGGSPGKALHLIVEGGHAPEYWIHLEAGPTATLMDLDGYLRRLWLECCGHLSGFEINGVRYSDGADFGWGDEGEPMTKRLSRVLRPGEAGLYEYDFGSTTELWIRALGEIPKRTGPRPLILLARSEAPNLPCVECVGSPAVQVCTVCYYETGGWLCEKCAPDHVCGEEALLPIVNSPRTGVCAYTGD